MEEAQTLSVWMYIFLKLLIQLFQTEQEIVMILFKIIIMSFVQGITHKNQIRQEKIISLPDDQ